MRQYPDLFLIDEGIALLSCYYELFDILRKIFCSCHRCIKYYYFYDKNIKKRENMITNDFNVKFFD